VAEELARHVEASGATYLVGRMMFGDMTEAQATDSIDRFAAEVLPRLATLTPVG
jgi:hypothetical protein